MGIYDDLQNLSQSPTVKPLSKPAEADVERVGVTSAPIQKQKVNRRKSSPRKLKTHQELPEEKKSDTLSGTQASMHARMQANKEDDTVETIRKAVRVLGKEEWYVRLTPTEKRELGAVVYTFNEMYRGQGRKTSENEIGRIALNFLLIDYRTNGEHSILAQVMAALNA